MLVFADLHHFGLFNSLKLLFEDRLGGTLYRPIGEDWLHRGYWRMAEIYNNHPATVAQYLGIRPDYTLVDGVYKIYEAGHDFTQNAITLDTFFSLPIDIVIATIPEHIESFKRLCNEHPNHPKLIYQIGNAWPVEAGLAPNIMASAKIANVPSNINFVEYHQEFDLNIFKPAPPVDTKNIYSFINCLNTASIYAEDWQLFQKLEQLMPDWVWRSYGGSCRDGQANGQLEVAQMMSQSRFVWHTKAFGDGYGHVLHNSAAVARPTITKRQYYIGKMGESLMVDGVTCIAIDNLGTDEIINKINYYNEQGRYCQMVQNVADNFREVVNFDLDTARIKTFLDKLI